MTVALVIVGKVDYHATVKKENMNKLKQWVFGIILLILSPLLLFLAMFVSIAIKLPIWIFLLYNEIWQSIKEKRK